MPERPNWFDSRRAFLAALAGGAGLALAPGRVAARSLAAQATGWAARDAILARITAPVFPARDFDITRFGARGDGSTDASGAIRDAIGACAAAGGGRVVVPAGRFLTGAIRLKSRVNLHVSEGATLLFQRDPRAYLPVVFTRFEGMELFNYEEADSGPHTPILRDVEVRNVTSQKSRYGLLLRGYARAPIADIRIVDCQFDGVAEGDRLEGVRDVVFSNVRINGTVRNERVTRSG